MKYVAHPLQYGVFRPYQQGHCFVAQRRQPRSQSLHLVALQPPALWAPGVALGGGRGRELELICQGHTRGSSIPSLLVVQIREWGFLCRSPHNLREVQLLVTSGSRFLRRVQSVLRPGLTPDSLPPSWQQRPPASSRPWPLGLSGPTLLFFLLWPFVVQWLFRQFRTQKR